ncbi:MAG: mannose-1-phosphate guanylyltransferase [Bacteroidota bacterium]
MSRKNLYGLIMAGGVGSRFWPISTEEKPKQFLDILGFGKSLLQLTFERLNKKIPTEQIYILTNKTYFSLVKEHLPFLKDEQIICEPHRKNTAPCILYAALKIQCLDPDSTLVISPSDHLILQEDRFNEQFLIAVEAAQEDKLITLGIHPTRPDTGYGYIEFDSKIERKAGKVAEVIQFREKPNLKQAEVFLSAGNFFWNAGIFIWKTATILNEFEKIQPELVQLFKEISIDSPDENSQLDKAFFECENISIDYAILEKSDKISMVLTDFDWSDLGTWGSLSEKISSDESGNSAIHASSHFFNAKNNLVISSQAKKIVIDGLNKYIVVDSGDKLLIMSKENEDQLKTYLKTIGEII